MMAKTRLEDLEQRIARQETELQQLRRELESRRQRLAGLAARKNELTAQLRQVETEIAAVAKGVQRTEAMQQSKSLPLRKIVVHAGTTRNGSATGRPPRAGKRVSQPPLRTILTSLLRNTRQPLAAKDLAKQARDAGYQSNSKDFTNVVWVALGKMDNVKNLPSGGYCLKK